MSVHAGLTATSRQPPALGQLLVDVAPWLLWQGC
jgi:hypothetical protein